jgi:methionyl-tRNA formyltransferase
MRLVFAGTPEAALPALEAVLESHHEVAAVVTRPDAPAGRGRRFEPSPVARRAREAGLEVLTPPKARDPAFLDRLREIGPDCCPVTAYGALLPQAALDIPPRGWVNLHFSVLPAWRGASPVQHAILHGDDVTGATTFRIVKELDAGPVYGVVTEPVRSRDTAGELMARLARSGARLLADTLDGIESGQIRAVPQPDEGVSYAPKITPEDARVDWGHPAASIDRLIRACTPEPGAWTEFGGTRLKLGPVEPAAAAAVGAAVPGGGAVPGDAEFAAGRDGDCGLAPGELLITRGAVFAGTGTGPVRLGDVQPPGKRPMPAADWARGLHVGSSGQPPKLG